MQGSLDSHYDVTQAQIDSFQNDGFIRLKNVFSAEEIAHYGAELTKLTLDLANADIPIEERSTYKKAFLQVSNLWEQSPVAKEFVFGKRLAGIAAALMEVRGVRLYHDQALYKEPGGGITPAHADQSYWPMASTRVCTAWIPLQAVSQEMGPLAFYAGSQKVEFGRGMGISDESEAQITEAMLQHGFPVVAEPYDLGEVSFHLGWTFHRAGENVSANPRSVMTVIYMDSDMRLLDPTNHMQAVDRECFCPGVAVGEVIASDINPLLFEHAA